MQVRVFGSLRQFVGQKALEVEIAPRASVRCLLDQLVVDHPVLKDKFFDENGDLRSSIRVLLNGRHIDFLGGLATTVQRDDQVAIFPPVGGG